ncbi:MAG: hypothetical protein ACTTJ7_00315, partial [Treponema sp.]
MIGPNYCDFIFNVFAAREYGEEGASYNEGFFHFGYYGNEKTACQENCWKRFRMMGNYLGRSRRQAAVWLCGASALR